MKKIAKSLLLSVLTLSMVVGLLTAVFALNPVTAKAASDVIRVESLTGTNAAREQIGDGYFWTAYSKKNHRTYVYYSETEDGAKRYLWRTQPDVPAGSILVVGDNVYFTIETADYLKHWIYSVNLTGTRKLTKIIGFKSKVEKHVTLENFYNDNVYYLFGNVEDEDAGLSRVDTTTNKKKGLRSGVEVLRVCGQFLYLHGFGSPDYMVYDCAQNKNVKNVVTPDGFVLDSMYADEDSNLSIYVYRKEKVQDNMVTFWISTRKLNGTGYKDVYKEISFENGMVYGMDETHVFIQQGSEGNTSYLQIDATDGSITPMLLSQPTVEEEAPAEETPATETTTTETTTTEETPATETTTTETTTTEEAPATESTSTEETPATENTTTETTTTEGTTEESATENK